MEYVTLPHIFWPEFIRNNGFCPEFPDSGCHFFLCIYHCERVIPGQSNLLFLPGFPEST